ncbi:uncharacterized protein TRAVEDRAFT_45221 [Trametes versicolor FP-101664 SS1]|uniref:uncharacterized protein n=1 Tax=Trametes versicolor (strain FP-101664) TaxID=717944 RepID=UPI000462431D|nr:uncharacterized protein TRAVEDRAFT_45221 [Trametes versicolor FP-101664 SS1]EIW62401.1 hypothetical protein TRAVEDRAFT_45221 [Trametes versicolor FP-101664 SS1]
MNFDTTEHVLRGLPTDGGLSLPFVRAVPRQTRTPEGEETGTQRRRTVSLVLLHGAASHKEVWFPTLEHLFELQKEDSNRALTIVEAWAADMPSNGRAAVLNEHLLGQFPDGISGQQASRALQVLLKSDMLKGDDVIGIGYSAGACVMIQSTAGYYVDKLPYSSLILVEPVVLDPEVLEQISQADSPLTKIIEFARTRRDTWPSRAAAREWFAGQLPWSQWDARVLDLYVEHALRELPTAAYPDEHEGVTPATTRAAEIAAYSHWDDALEAHQILQGLCAAIPVHSVVGSVRDRIPGEVHELTGPKMKSVRQVEGVGHHVVQQDPRGAAEAIWTILQEEYSP